MKVKLKILIIISSEKIKSNNIVINYNNLYNFINFIDLVKITISRLIIYNFKIVFINEYNKNNLGHTKYRYI